VTLADTPRYSPSWLELRERADAEARATGLLEPLRHYLAGVPTLVVRDLGSGTGAMQRWTAAQLKGPQRWILHDRDPDLLAEAWGRAADTAADGAPVVVETEQGDLTRLTAEDLAGTSLVTASALLDLLTLEDVDNLAAACCQAGVPALLTLSVSGRVEFDPVDPLDATLEAGFQEHLHHGVERRQLLGTEAGPATTEAFSRHGAKFWMQPSPWRLGPDQAPLMSEWLRGWVPAACARRPDLAEDADEYLRRRLSAAAAGTLRVTVHHVDVLALP
jgi:hypothetical protein